MGMGTISRGSPAGPLGTAVRSVGPGVPPQLCHFLAVGPWASDLTPTCLTFPISDMGQQSNLPRSFAELMQSTCHARQAREGSAKYTGLNWGRSQLPPPPPPPGAGPAPAPPAEAPVLLQKAAQALQLGSPELGRPRAPRAKDLPQPLQRVREGVHPAGRGSVGQGTPPPGALHCPCLHPVDCPRAVG